MKKETKKASARRLFLYIISLRYLNLCTDAQLGVSTSHQPLATSHQPLANYPL